MKLFIPSGSCYHTATTTSLCTYSDLIHRCVCVLCDGWYHGILIAGSYGWYHPLIHSGYASLLFYLPKSVCFVYRVILVSVSPPHKVSGHYAAGWLSTTYWGQGTLHAGWHDNIMMWSLDITRSWRYTAYRAMLLTAIVILPRCHTHLTQCHVIVASSDSLSCVSACYLHHVLSWLLGLVQSTD